MIRSISRSSMIAACAAIAGLSGCAYDYAAERSFGESVSVAIREQTIRPDGVGRNGLAVGLEGQASKAVIDRYYRSYEFPQSLGNVYTLGVGTGSAPVSGAGPMQGAGAAVGVGGR